MDEEYRNQLEAELKMARRLLNADKLTQAHYGMSCDPAILIRIENREKEIARIEARLGITWPTPPARRRSYEPPPRPRQDFEREVGAQQDRARQQDVEHQMSLLKTHRFNLAHYRSQIRMYGIPAAAPPVTIHGLNEARDGIGRCKNALRQLGVAVEDLPGDE